MKAGLGLGLGLRASWTHRLCSSWHGVFSASVSRAGLWWSHTKIGLGGEVGDLWERKRPETWEALLVSRSKWISFTMTQAGRFVVGHSAFPCLPCDLEPEAVFSAIK